MYLLFCFCAKITMKVFKVKNGQTKRIWGKEQKLAIIKRYYEDHISAGSLVKEYDADKEIMCQWIQNFNQYGEVTQIGTYQILFQVSVTEAGQLILTLNGEDLAYTVVGRATGTSQIVGMAIVTTTTINSILTVRNPAGNAAALTITPLAGGTRPVSAHLVITQIG